MNDEQKKSTSTDLTVIDTEASAVPTPSERILAPLTLADYSQFLYETNFGGKKGQDFTFEGIKTLGLNNGISTGEVRIEFLNDEKTEALFYCTATDRNGDTSGVVIQQNQKENGRDNPHWISKGCSRSMRNAIKARLPVQLFKTALQKAIASGEAKQSAIVEAQKACGQAYIENADPLGMTKKQCFVIALSVYGESDFWNVSEWETLRDALRDPTNFKKYFNGSDDT